MSPLNDPASLTNESYIRLTSRHLWDNLPLILFASLTFSLFCFPTIALLLLGLVLPAMIIGILTIAPAWVALLALKAEILQGNAVNIYTMFKMLPHYWFSSVKLGGMIAIPITAILLTLPLFTQPEIPTITWIGLAADTLGLLLLAILFLYAFPLLVLYEVGFRAAVQNAFILASRHLINTFGLLGLGLLLFLGAIYLSSGLLFIIPAIWGMFIVNNCRLVVSLEEDI
jgi:uncharacterized membrane protein YesL